MQRRTSTDRAVFLPLETAAFVTPVATKQSAGDVAGDRTLPGDARPARHDLYDQGCGARSLRDGFGGEGSSAVASRRALMELIT
jgi:hypothetical protein